MHVTVRSDDPPVKPRRDTYENKIRRNYVTTPDAQKSNIPPVWYVYNENELTNALVGSSCCYRSHDD